MVGLGVPGGLGLGGAPGGGRGRGSVRVTSPTPFPDPLPAPAADLCPSTLHPPPRNFQGQLGLGDPNDFERNERNHPYLSSFRVIKGLQGQRVTQFACGGEHSAALLASDDVYTFGSGCVGESFGAGTNPKIHYSGCRRREGWLGGVGV